MCVLCMLRVGIFFNKKLVRVGLQETNNIFRPNIIVAEF